MMSFIGHTTSNMHLRDTRQVKHTCRQEPYFLETGSGTVLP